MKVLFIQAKANKDIIEALNKNIKYIPEKKIGTVTTVQFVEQLEKVKQTLEANNKIAVIGKPSGSAITDGQILGCDVSAATNIASDVDCFLYIGTGNFHSLGLLAKTDKPLYALNPFTSQLKEISLEEKQKLMKREILKLAQFKDCKTVGILVSTKLGQCQLQYDVEELKEKLEIQGKKAYLFACDNITNAELQNFPHIQGWVNTACPRLADDVFDRPFINACEL
jgi:2-(3-amino-3-carboxypropyl)histidine synthase